MKVLIAMSGGVDSSVAAYIMKERGYDCIGATMHLYDADPRDKDSSLMPNDPDAGEGTCCSRSDAEDARRIAEGLGMSFEVLDYRDEFRDRVIRYFVETYENGGTPNPCIECNRYMKFDKLLEYANSKGAELVATGHYARVEFNEETGRYLLKKGFDAGKDQSYVLYKLTQDQLAHIVFPLGEISKSEVRKIAENHGFVNAAKKESQDICFIPDGDYVKFIEEFTGKAYPDGDFVSDDGERLGRHRGIIRYTIGQRKGLGVASRAPLFVTKLDTEKNEVVLSHGDGLFHREVLLSDINLISVPEIEGEMRVTAKIRYRHKEEWATATQEVRENADGQKENVIRLVFDEPQRAPTKGQSAVLYDGDVVVGGGVITD